MEKPGSSELFEMYKRVLRLKQRNVIMTINNVGKTSSIVYRNPLIVSYHDSVSVTNDRYQFPYDALPCPITCQ